MPDRPDIGHPLHLRVLEDDLLRKYSVHRDVDILVDRGANERGAKTLVVGGKVCTASTERETQWGLDDDQVSRIPHAPPPDQGSKNVRWAAVAVENSSFGQR